MQPRPGFDIYVNLEQEIDVEAHLIKSSELRVIGEFFDVSIFMAGDYLVTWPNGRNNVVTPEIFSLKYRKKETEDGEVRPQERCSGDSGSSDQDGLPARASQHIGDARELPEAERGRVDEVPAQGGEDSVEVRELNRSVIQEWCNSLIRVASKDDFVTRVYFDSIDDARSFAMEMQYAIDHPEEQDEGRQFDEDEIKQAKFYIRKAKEYLAARDESL
jgi:hypothetical protein